MRRRVGRSSSLLHVLAAMTLAATLTACGTTVQDLGTAGTAGDGLGTDEGLSLESGQTTTGPGTSTRGAPAFGGPAAIAAGSASPATGRAGGPSAGRVVGVTSTEIRVGFGTQKDADQAAVQFGLNAAFGDQEAQARAIADDINARGGVLGRKLVIVFHDERAASDIENPDLTAAAQCADWTQDRPVFAGINIVGARNRESLFACMAKARTPLLFSDLVPHTRHVIETFAPYLYAPGVATIDRWAPTWLERLDARGYFQPWDTTAGAKGTAPVKVGVPFTDSDEGHRYFKIVSKALAAVGRRVDDSFAFSSDAGTALQQIPAMILRFQTNDITHVLLPASAYLVTPIAERQQYRPRYAMTTIDGLSSLTVTTSPREQLRGTMGVGWLPVSDVDAAHDPGPVSPNQTRCKQVLERAGLDTSNRLTFTTQLIVCDLFYFLEAALSRAGAVSPSALQQGAAALGDAFPSAMTFVERYGPNRFDGAAAVRDLYFDDRCSCFVFFDRVNRPLPT